MGTDRQLLKSVMERKLRYFGHIMRRPGECLEKTVIQGCIQGNRPRGRPVRSWINDILESGGNELYTGTVAAAHRRPPSMERDGPFSIQPSALMKDQEEGQIHEVLHGHLSILCVCCRCFFVTRMFESCFVELWLLQLLLLLISWEFVI